MPKRSSLYQTIVVVVAFAALAILGIDSSESAGTETSYDRWYRMLPQVPLGWGVTFYYDTEIEDYFALFMKQKSEIENPKSIFEQFVRESVGFFSGTIVIPVDIREIDARFGLLTYTRRYRYDDGFEVLLKTLDSRPTARCPQELNHYLELRNPTGGVVKSVMVLYRLSEPTKTSVSQGCPNEPSTAYSRSVVSLGGQIGVVLKDESFLLSGPAPDNDADIIVRLTRDLAVPEPCRIPNVLIVNLKELPDGFGIESRNSPNLQNIVKEFFISRKAEQCN